MNINNTLTGLLFGLSFAIWLTACGSSPTEVRDKAVKKQAELKLKSSMNDPESYEFASLTLLDSTLYSENAAALRNQWQVLVDSYADMVRNEVNYQSDPLLNTLFNADRLREYQSSLDSTKATLGEIKRLTTAMGADTNNVAAYTYEFAFRGTNAMGAKVLSRKFIQTGGSPNFEIIAIGDELGELKSTPGGVRGYEALVKQMNKE